AVVMETLAALAVMEMLAALATSLRVTPRLSDAPPRFTGPSPGCAPFFGGLQRDVVAPPAPPVGRERAAPAADPYLAVHLQDVPSRREAVPRQGDLHVDGPVRVQPMNLHPHFACRAVHGDGQVQALVADAHGVKARPVPSGREAGGEADPLLVRQGFKPQEVPDDGHGHAVAGPRLDEAAAGGRHLAGGAGKAQQPGAGDLPDVP